MHTGGRARPARRRCARACGLSSVERKARLRYSRYYLDRAQVANTAAYGIWKDQERYMIFSKIDAVLNTGTLEEITEKLDAAWEAHPQKGFWEFLMHEQYFYPDYRKYLPDFKARIFTALDWAERHHLTPAFLCETHLSR